VLLEKLTREIIGAAMEVHRTLGPGFLESIYRNALYHELHSKRLSVESEREIRVTYKNHAVGHHRLDLVVENRVIVELKAASSIADAHLAQALSYMKATNIEVSLIVNFGGTSLTWKRLLKTRN
jgi:GxxExxY protein